MTGFASRLRKNPFSALTKLCKLLILRSTKADFRGSRTLFPQPARVLLSLGPLVCLTTCSPSRPDPCLQASELRTAIEQYRRGRAVEALERKKDALDDQIDKLEMTPEQYRRLHEKYQEIDRTAGPVVAEWEAKEQQQQARNMELLAEAEANCKANQK